MMLDLKKKSLLAVAVAKLFILNGFCLNCCSVELRREEFRQTSK